MTHNLRIKLRDDCFTARTILGCSESEFALLTGMTPSKIRKWESLKFQMPYGFHYDLICEIIKNKDKLKGFKKVKKELLSVRMYRILDAMYRGKVLNKEEYLMSKDIRARIRETIFLIKDGKHKEAVERLMDTLRLFELYIIE